MRWGAGEYWWLVALPILAVTLFVYGHMMRRTLARKAGSSKLIQELINSLSVERRMVKQFLLILAVSLVVIASFDLNMGSDPNTVRAVSSLSPSISVSRCLPGMCTHLDLTPRGRSSSN